MRTIHLPCYNITIELADLGGSITSDLKEDKRPTRLNAALDAIESLILAHAIAGIDVESPAYLEGIESAVDAVSNNLG